MNLIKALTLFSLLSLAGFGLAAKTYTVKCACPAGDTQCKTYVDPGTAQIHREINNNSNNDKLSMSNHQLTLDAPSSEYFLSIRAWYPSSNADTNYLCSRELNVDPAATELDLGTAEIYPDYTYCKTNQTRCQTNCPSANLNSKEQDFGREAPHPDRVLCIQKCTTDFNSCMKGQ